jgi:hypothetical protein
MNQNGVMVIELRRKVKALEGILDEIAGAAGKRPA